MASIYRRKRNKPIPPKAEIVEYRGKQVAEWVDGKTGRKRRAPLNATGDKIVVESGSYLISYFDKNDQRIETNSLTRDKSAAEQIAAKLESDVALRKRGVIDEREERLAKHAATPLGQHIENYRAVLQARENTQQHVELTEARIRWILASSEITRFSDLTPSAVQQSLKVLIDDGGSLETANSYLRAIKSFSAWLFEDKRIAEDSLARMEQYNAETDRRHPRRALTTEEVAVLLDFFEGFTLPAHRISGPDRAMAYRICLGTGFRRKELRSLTPESFDLESDPPIVTVVAASSKRRKKDEQPIRRDLADRLRHWLSDREPKKPLFNHLPGNTARSSCPKYENWSWLKLRYRRKIWHGRSATQEGRGGRQTFGRKTA